MAIEKFRFVSPGVQFNEIDESVIAPAPPAIGPVVIGRTAKGPTMQPVLVNSVADLEKVFGSTFNGNVGSSDVWRSGIPTSPTLATYAAKAFLRNSGPVTVIRLGAVTAIDGETGATGWSDVLSGSFGLFAVSGTTATLGAIVYTSGSVLQLSKSVGGFVASGSSSLDSSDSVTLRVSGAVGGATEFKVSLKESSVNYARDVLNTNPTRIYADKYFIGETFEKSISSAHTQIYLKPLSEIQSAWKTFTSGAINAESGWVADDHAAGVVPSQLFRFLGLESGASLTNEIKISIENVRASRNTAVTKYGTFDVVIRKLFETSNATSVVLERFNGVNLDVASDDYIAKRIGDSYRYWDATNLHYVEVGNYPNRSAYVRVEMASDDISPTALPHGFFIKGVPSFGTLDGLTASHATASMLTSTVNGNTAKSTRFGLVAHPTNNADLVEILRQKPAVSVAADVLFSTRFISGSTNNDIKQYASGTYNTTDVLTAGYVSGFNMPMFGGFDGIDIFEKEPFINEAILTSNVSELNSAAYRSVKRAIDIVADPEVLDMNLLVVPGLKNKTLTSRMIEVCQLRGDAMAVIDLEGDYKYAYENSTRYGAEQKPTSVTSTISSLTDRAIDSSYGAAYFPAVFVASESIFMPASVAALGAVGGTEGRAAVWFAPAGFSRGGLTEGSSGIGVSRTALQLNASDRDALYDVNINPIVSFPNEGVVIFGQKTLQQTPSALDRVNVRRLLNFVKKEISRAATRILFEPNVEDTWRSFTGVVEPFLQNIKNNFGLDDARVILDSTTTTADLIDRNTLYCKILLKPTRAIEFIGIDFVVTNSGAAFSE
jgi:hypothetical protein